MNLLDNQGNPKYTNIKRDEISSKSVVRGTALDIANNVQSFNFNVGPLQKWKPLLSEWTLRLSLTAVGGGQLNQAADIALALNMALNGWQYLHFFANNQKIDEISEHVAEVSSIRTRLEKPDSWFKSAGKQKIWDTSFKQRQNLIISDAPSGADKIVTQTTLPDLYTEFLVVAPNQVIIADSAANAPIGSVITFSVNGGNAIPDLQLVLKKGDLLEIGGALDGQNGGNTGKQVRITDITATSITVSPQIDDLAGAINVAAGNFLNVIRIRETTSSFNDFNILPIYNGKDELEISFKLPLGVSYCDEMPPGDYEFRLRGFSKNEFARRLIQSLTADKAFGVNFAIDIKDLYYQPYFVEGNQRMDEGTIVKTFKCWQAQKKKALASSNDLQFTTASNLHAIGFACQDSRVGSQSRYSPAFMTSYNGDVDPTNELANRTDLDMNYYQIRYAGKYFPEPAQQDAFTTRNNKKVQSYMETYKHSGSLYYEGCCETYDDYIRRGPLYFWQFPRDKNTYATEARINIKYNGAPGNNTDIVLFWCYYRTVKLVIKGGKIVSVDTDV
jgi:hypothetical protein